MDTKSSNKKGINSILHLTVALLSIVCIFMRCGARSKQQMQLKVKETGNTVNKKIQYGPALTIKFLLIFTYETGKNS